MPSPSTKRLALAATAAMIACAIGEPTALAQQTTPTTKTPEKKGAADKKAADKKAPQAEEKDEKKKPEGESAKAELSTDGAAASGGPEAPERSRAIYIGLEAGLTRQDLAGLSDSTSLDRTAGNGFSYGIGAGVRFGHLRLGAKFRGFATTEFEMWSGLAEVGWGLGTRPFNPVFFLRAGYIWSVELERATMATSLPPGNFLEPEVHVRGAVVGVEAFGGYWLNDIVRMGPFIGADVMFLSREQAPLPTSVLPGQIPDEFRQKPLYTETGSAVGYTINLGIRGAVDLGF